MEFKLISINEAEAMSDFYTRNSDHLRPWEPLRDAGYHSVEAWKSRLKEKEIEQSGGRAAYFVSYNSKDNEVIATCSLTNIVKGSFQACNIGYAISERYQGQGLMKELCSYVIDYAFSEIGLNRIMANYIPRNQRSETLLNNLGFTKEGVSKKYLLINGKWEDHVLTSLLNPQNTKHKTQNTKHKTQNT